MRKTGIYSESYYLGLGYRSADITQKKTGKDACATRFSDARGACTMG